MMSEEEMKQDYVRWMSSRHVNYARQRRVYQTLPCVLMAVIVFGGIIIAIENGWIR